MKKFLPTYCGHIKMKSEVCYIKKLSALLYTGIIHLILLTQRREVESFVLNRGLILKLYYCSNDFMI